MDYLESIISNFSVEYLSPILSYKDWYDDIRKETNIQSGQLAGLHNWSDLIRKSRNAIHFGVKLDTEINYEKTAVILLASIDNFKLIYALKDAADKGNASPHPCFNGFK